MNNTILNTAPLNSFGGVPISVIANFSDKITIYSAPIISVSLETHITVIMPTETIVITDEDEGANSP